MSQAITLTVTPSTMAIAVTGKLVARNIHTVTVSNSEANWDAAHAYRLTIKRLRGFAGTPFVANTTWSVSGADATGTVNLNVAGILSFLGLMSSRDEFLIEWRDDTDGVTLGYADTIEITNSISREDDTPESTVDEDHTYTDSEVDTIAAAKVTPTGFIPHRLRRKP